MYWCYDRSQKTCNIKRENPYCSSIFMPFVNPQRIKNLSQTWTLVQVPFKRFWGTWSPKTFLEALKCYKTNQRVLKKSLKEPYTFSKFSGLDIQEIGWDFLCFSGKLGFDGNEGGVMCSAFGVTQLLLFSWLHIAHIESFLLGLEFKLSHQGAGWWHSIEAVEWCNPHFPFCLAHDFSTPTIIFLA